MGMNFMASEKIEEYKELRSEIRNYLNRRQQNLYFAIIISLGVIGIGLRKSNYLLFLSSSILIAFLWYDEIRRLRAIFRAATYIQVFIEAYIKDLNWETFGAKHQIQTNFIGRILANAEFPTLFILNAALGFSLLKFLNKYIFILLIILYSLIFLSLFNASYKVAKRGRSEELKYWEKIKKMKI